MTERNLLAGRILDGLWDGEEVCEDSEEDLDRRPRDPISSALDAPTAARFP